MYDGICISNKNKNSILRCHHKSKLNTLLCGYHKKGTTKLYIDLLRYQFTPINLHQLYMLKKKVCSNKIWKLLRKTTDHSYLDTKYGDYLITGDSSWKDVPKQYLIYLNKNELWDIRFLKNHFATQLNFSNNSIYNLVVPFL